MTSRRHTLLAGAIVALLSLSWSPCAPAFAEGADDGGASEHLLGDWGGARKTLEDNYGLTFEVVATADVLSDVSGGIRRGTKAPLNLDMTMLWDTKKAGLWDGGKLFVYALGDTGGKPSTRSGELQVASNIEAEESAKIYELWFEQSFADEFVSVLIGLHDYNSEFDALEYSGTLLNSSFGIEQDISQVGPSIFPTTSLAARLRIEPTKQSYAMAAVYDGVPGRVDNPRGTHIALREDDGVFIGTEAGLTGPEDAPADYYKIALGGWYHSKKFEDFAGRSRSKNAGVYLIGERRLWSEEDPKQGLGAFFQVGFADSSRNQTARYFGGGLSYTGAIPTRDEDILAVAFASALDGGSYRRNVEGADLAETVLELNYRAKVTGWMALQPDLQYIINPSTDPALDNALVIGGRVEISL